MIINIINNIKYYGRRVCNCPIEEDDYLGSGKLLKLAIDKYGKNNFKKTIICICDSDEEMYEKEKEYINKFNAVYSYNYYNIDFGGAPKSNVKLDKYQIRKYNYMKKQIELDDPTYYYYKYDKIGNPQKNISPCVNIAKVGIDENRRVYIEYRTLYDNSMKKPGLDTSKVYNDQYVNFFSFEYAMNVLKDKDYKTISKKGYDFFQLLYGTCMEFMDDTFDFANRIDAGFNIDDAIIGCTMNKAVYKAIISKDVVDKDVIDNATVKTGANNATKDLIKNGFVDRIKKNAKTSSDFNYFKKLCLEYEKDFKITEIYYAITGRASIQGNYLKNNFNCSEDEYKNAREALNYLLKFKDVVSKVGGHRSFLNMVILFCYKFSDVDNDELIKKLHKSYKNVKPITYVESLSDAVNQIERCYNYLRNTKNKVDISRAFDRERANIK
jgi:hypothetical protein